MKDGVKAVSTGPHFFPVDEDIVGDLLQADLSAVRVYLTLRRDLSQRRSGWWYPHGYSDLGAAANVSTRSAQRAVEWLWRRGLLEVDRRQRADGGDDSHRFRVPQLGRAAPPPACSMCGSVWHVVDRCPKVETSQLHMFAADNVSAGDGHPVTDGHPPDTGVTLPPDTGVGGPPDTGVTPPLTPVSPLRQTEDRQTEDRQPPVPLDPPAGGQRAELPEWGQRAVSQLVTASCRAAGELPGELGGGWSLWTCTECPDGGAPIPADGYCYVCEAPICEYRPDAAELDAAELVASADVGALRVAGVRRRDIERHAAELRAAALPEVAHWIQLMTRPAFAPSERPDHIGRPAGRLSSTPSL